MQPKRYLSEAALKNEGEATGFDRGTAFGDYEPEGAGLRMRPGDATEGLRWYVVRDNSCSYDINDEEAEVWTLSRSPDATQWETDSGFGGYGLTYGQARELADAANAAAGAGRAAGGAVAGSADDR